MSGHVFNITRVGDGVAAAGVINLHSRVAPYECCIREKRATLVFIRSNREAVNLQNIENGL